MAAPPSRRPRAALAPSGATEASSSRSVERTAYADRVAATGGTRRRPRHDQQEQQAQGRLGDEVGHGRLQAARRRCGGGCTGGWRGRAFRRGRPGAGRDPHPLHEQAERAAPGPLCPGSIGRLEQVRRDDDEAPSVPPGQQGHEHQRPRVETAVSHVVRPAATSRRAGAAGDGEDRDQEGDRDGQQRDRMKTAGAVRGCVTRGSRSSAPSGPGVAGGAVRRSAPVVPVAPGSRLCVGWVHVSRCRCSTSRRTSSAAGTCVRAGAAGEA